MLVLTRKLNETIVINGNITVTLVGIRGNQVRLGITAPESVGVFRSELCDRATSPRIGSARSVPEMEHAAT